ncbi:uncharacterized mitochondrial protein-like protein [Tanacetum coccineum]
MQGRFQMSSIGELIFFLGLQFKQKTDGIFISQDKYVADMLTKFDLASVKTVITPMETKMALTKDEEADDVDVDSLEKDLKQTKLTMGKAIVKLVMKVKKMEVVLKRIHVVLTDLEDEDAKNSSKQGRNLQEEREADISPEGLEVAKTLAKVLTQRTKTYTRKVKTGLRRKLDADEVSTGEGINTGFTDVNTAFEEIKSGDDEVNSGDESIIPSPKKSQREGKVVLEEESQSKRTKKQIREEQASLAKIDELELSETQNNRMAQVQEAAKYYTEEDWDSVRAKLEANRDLSSKVLSIDFTSDDFAKKMVELINENKRLFKEQRERDRRNRTMTQAEQGST